MRTERTSGESDAPGFVEVLRIRAFSVVFTAELQSLVGDQLARVALSALVFDRTGSVAATSATYAMTFLPAVVGGTLLARLGDRLSRRGVMVGCDLVRAAAFGVLALPGLPLWALVALVVLAVLFEPVFSAAQVAYLADGLSGEHFRATTGLRMASHQGAQVLGFAAGGVIVAAIDPRGALAVNAATFLVSAVLIGVLLPPQQQTGGTDHESNVAPANRPRVSTWREQRMRLLLALMVLAGLFVVPEGLAIPLAAQLHASTVVAGLLLASIPLGGAFGALLLVRVVRPKYRESTSGVMAIACGVPLLITALQPPWPLVFLAWMASGAASAYQVEVITEIARAAPSERRSSVVGFAAGALVTAQGVGLAAFGALAQPVGPAAAVAIAGAVGSGLAAVVVAIRRVSSVGAAHVPSAESAADVSAAHDRPAGHMTDTPQKRVIEAPKPSSRNGHRPMPTAHRSTAAGHSVRRPRPFATQEPAQR